MLKADCEDPNGGIFYSRYDRTRVETNWRTTVRKEREAFRAKQTGPPMFQMNLMNQNGSAGPMSINHSHNRIEIVAEKEIKQSPQARRSIKGMDPESFEVKAIRHLDKKPTEKWDLPLKSSHDIGWLLSNPVRASTLESWHKPGRPGLRTKSSSTGSLPKAGEAAVGTEAGRALVAPANDYILERTKSEPKLIQGPPSEMLLQLNNRRWYRPQRSNDVTKYTEIYTKLLHHSPFNQSEAGR
eukprot:TRINITY_DN7561_c0_g1_i1.p1 TRINITY_DN7561_c0_g1~~TRINITY_DN7561_c0_g1_i1.p1  ORF type:complete len:241 (+),score=45.35 TRINITY_DN7561_c0_g1_i1:135-857(+)